MTNEMEARVLTYELGSLSYGDLTLKLAYSFYNNKITRSFPSTHDSRQALATTHSIHPFYVHFYN